VRTFVGAEPNSDEATLVAAAANGDADAFMALLARHDDQLRAVVFRVVKSQHTMDDVLQDTYVKAFRGLGRFDRRSSFRTWLFRIAFNAAIDATRKTARVEPVADVDVRSAIDQAPEIRRDVEDALSQLSPEHAATVLLVDAYGFDHASAAQVLGVPTGTVSSRLVHARRALRHALAGYGKEER
jgi:RNA polymerase sigma-70 factor (ECF subfamily)